MASQHPRRHCFKRTQPHSATPSNRVLVPATYRRFSTQLRRFGGIGASASCSPREELVRSRWLPDGKTPRNQAGTGELHRADCRDGSLMRWPTAPIKTAPYPSKRDSRIDGSFPRPVADVEARRSRPPEAWPGRLPSRKGKKRGAWPIPDRVPIRGIL